jgi:hypothetical protein
VRREGDSRFLVGNVHFVKLDIYRSCTRSEKMEVLDTFWRRNHEAPSRIKEAALQYGPFAVACLIAIAAEVAFVIALTISRAYVVGIAAVLCEVLVLWSLWWALVRTRDIKRLTS